MRSLFLKIENISSCKKEYLFVIINNELMMQEMTALLVFHVDANSADLSWTAAYLLKQGYETDLRDIPLAIAGDPENRHGIILAKSIPAKKYGIKTGESLFEAKQKYLEPKVFPPDYDLLLLCSDAMYKILSEYTPIIQRYSVDECFCDVSRSVYVKDHPVEAAYEIKDRIKNELGFTVNIGIGENKLCAKMAGELKKPDMVHTLWQEEIPTKLWALPVSELFMVGRATTKKLQQMNIKTIGELANTSPILLKSVLKSHGILIHNYANDIDDSPVTFNEDVIQKGVGNGLTYPYDLETVGEMEKEALALCERVGMRLRKLNRYASLVSVHLRNSSLRGYSHQVKLQSCISTTNEIYEMVRRLLSKMWKGEPVRAMSISVSDFSNAEQMQLSMFDIRD